MAARSSYGRDRRLRSYVTGLLLEARGDWEGARRAYEQAVWSPTENLAAARLARAALRTGRPRDATRVLEAYLRGPLDAANQYVPRWEVHQLLGEAYAALDLPARARPHYEWAERALARSEPSYRALLEGP
jgi:tetratricopeptide (TPR) repeat protein